jgi:isopentenyl phosphate kinase
MSDKERLQKIKEKGFVKVDYGDVVMTIHNDKIILNKDDFNFLVKKAELAIRSEEMAKRALEGDIQSE